MFTIYFEENGEKKIWREKPKHFFPNQMLMEITNRTPPASPSKRPAAAKNSIIKVQEKEYDYYKYSYDSKKVTNNGLQLTKQNEFSPNRDWNKEFQSCIDALRRNNNTDFEHNSVILERLSNLAEDFN